MITISDDILRQTMQEVIDLFLIPKFISLGMNASGEWISSLEARAANSTGEIWGRDYTYYLVNGRAPGKRPPTAPLVSWVGNKLNIYGKEALSVAYAIAKKIEKEGTDYYPSGTDLLEVLQAPEVSQYIYDRMAIHVNGQIEAEIKRSLKAVFA